MKIQFVLANVPRYARLKEGNRKEREGKNEKMEKGKFSSEWR